MNHIKLFEEFLNEGTVNSIVNEGASDILYHYIEPSYILKILENNKLTTIAAMGSDSDYDINKNKFFYLSTTRSKSSGYKRTRAKIVLDGRKIKQRYEITPVDYWQDEKSDKKSKRSYIRSMQSLEQEDRIITDKPSIANAKNYILGIHIYLEYKESNLPLSVTPILNDIDRKIIDICEKENIPIFIYDNKQNFFNQIKPIDYTKYNSNVGNATDKFYVHDEGVSRYFLRIASLISYKNTDYYNTIMKHISDDDRNEHSKFAHEEFINDFMDKTIPSSTNYELRKVLKSSISEIQSDSGEDSRFILDLLRRDMRKNKISSIEDYIKLKVSK